VLIQYDNMDIMVYGASPHFTEEKNYRRKFEGLLVRNSAV